MDRSQLNKFLLLVEQLTQVLDQEQEQEVEHGHTSGGLAFGGADLLSCGSTRDMLERANLRVALLGQFREPVKQGGSPVSLKTKPLRFRSGLGFQPGPFHFAWSHQQSSVDLRTYPGWFRPCLREISSIFKG